MTTTTLAYLQQALTENHEQLSSLLANRNYDEALVSMDNRLLLIDSLLQLVDNEPTLKQEAIALSTMLFRQEVSMKTVALEHHQAIFKELSSIGLANKAKKIYRVNSEGF